MDFLRLDILFLVVISILVVRTYFRKSWDTVQLPILIVISILSAFVILVILYAAYTMLSKTIFSVSEKMFYCLLVAGIIVAFAWLNISNWNKWKSEHGRKK